MENAPFFLCRSHGSFLPPPPLSPLGKCSQQGQPDWHFWSSRSFLCVIFKVCPPFCSSAPPTPLFPLTARVPLPLRTFPPCIYFSSTPSPTPFCTSPVTMYISLFHKSPQLFLNCYQHKCWSTICPLETWLLPCSFWRLAQVLPPKSGGVFTLLRLPLLFQEPGSRRFKARAPPFCCKVSFTTLTATFPPQH